VWIEATSSSEEKAFFRFRISLREIVEIEFSEGKLIFFSIGDFPEGTI